MTREWGGVTLDNRSAAMMDEVARLCPGISLQCFQGSYSGGVSASAGSHSGGGAIDLAPSNGDYDTVVHQMRRVGWAAWHRTPAQGFDHHIHGIAGPAGPGDLAPAAADQWDDYLAGRNGLANNAPDDGPRDFVGVTWETYQGGKNEPPEEDEVKPYAVNLDGAGLGWVLSDLATWHTGIHSYGVIEEGVNFGAYQFFAGGAQVGQGWVDHILRLPSMTG